MSVLIGKVNNSHVILNQVENVPRVGTSYSVRRPIPPFPPFPPATIDCTEYGEMPRMEWPLGYEHLLVGVLYEGWSLNYIVGGVDKHVHCIYGERSYPLAVPVSQQLVGNVKTVIVNSPDNVLQITFVFTNYSRGPRIDIGMTVRNISGSVVTDIRIKRHNDSDIDTGGWETEDHSGGSYDGVGYGWAGFYNFFDVISNGVIVYNTLRQDVDHPIPLGTGFQAHKFICYGVPFPTQALIDDWNDWSGRENTMDDYLLPYPTYGDYMISLTWDLGTLNPLQSSTTVTTVYMFDTSYTLTA